MLRTAIGGRQLLGRLSVGSRTIFIAGRRFGSNSQQNNAQPPRRIQLTAGSAAVVIVGGAVAARSIYGQFLQTPDNPTHAPIRRDASEAKVLLQRAGPTQQMPQIQEMDAAEFDAFCQRQRQYLKESKLCSQRDAAQLLHQQLQDILPVDRITAFSDWYFRYTTTYQLLGVAMRSALKHAVTFRNQETLAEQVAHELQHVVEQKYEAIVLRPALTDPKVHRAFVTSLKHAHASYLNAVSKMEESAAEFVSKQSQPYAQPLQSHQVVVNLDWTAQLQKVQHLPAAYEKTPTGVAFIAGGAAVGKLAGGVAMGGAAKALAAKLAAPFATKAAGAALGGKAAAGAATGALMAGPLGVVAGTVAGAAVGVGVDMTVNLGVALMQRSAFEQDVRESLEEMSQEWEDRLGQELTDVQSVWYGHALDVLAGSQTKRDNPRSDKSKIR